MVDASERGIETAREVAELAAPERLTGFLRRVILSAR
jgi:hypothetical protein